MRADRRRGQRRGGKKTEFCLQTNRFFRILGFVFFFPRLSQALDFFFMSAFETRRKMLKYKHTESLTTWLAYECSVNRFFTAYAHDWYNTTIYI